jgi:hypothetical protein
LSTPQLQAFSRRLGAEERRRFHYTANVPCPKRPPTSDRLVQPVGHERSAGDTYRTGTSMPYLY